MAILKLYKKVKNRKEGGNAGLYTKGVTGTTAIVLRLSNQLERRI